jgi:hypothetical protein
MNKLSMNKSRKIENKKEGEIVRLCCMQVAGYHWHVHPSDTGFGLMANKKTTKLLE